MGTIILNKNTQVKIQPAEQLVLDLVKEAKKNCIKLNLDFAAYLLQMCEIELLNIMEDKLQCR